MIYGIGTDIVQVSRFRRLCGTSGFIDRYFNQEEKAPSGMDEGKVCEHYACRFAAKEAFGKALGTGLMDLCLKDVYVTKDSLGKPSIVLAEKNLELFRKKCGGNAQIHLSLSHEKEYATAFVVIETIQQTGVVDG